MISRVISLVVLGLLLGGCGANGFRFKAGVDFSLTKVVRDSTATHSVTVSADSSR